MFMLKMKNFKHFIYELHTLTKHISWLLHEKHTLREHITFKKTTCWAARPRTSTYGSPPRDKNLLMFFLCFINRKLWLCGGKVILFSPNFAICGEKSYFFPWQITFFPGKLLFSRQITFFPAKRKIKKNKVNKKIKITH